ncbi:MAG: sigma-54-dependent Fis family transcriptional regulator [Planctomycetes bacterium]|nr:sigma-54-dependent Fis family transcriptional regulator [Planctomycetota bacterium]
MPKLLVVDDEPNIIYSIEACLSTPELSIISAGTARAGIDLVREEHPDAVILDVRLPDMSGLEAYDRIRGIDPRLPVIMLTAFARPETAIEAMQRGAFEYLLKPVDFTRLREVVRRAIAVSRFSRVPAVLSDSDAVIPTADRIVGQSALMQEIYKTIGRVAGQDATVLILGESGTGKELVARALYHYSKRNSMPFLAINCAALPEALLESELFGHERGAFTGADQRRIGKFEQVNGGTIFLDEIGDMTPATQAKALRLLQQQQFERIGGNVTITTDVRIIAATNKDLQTLVNQGKFRADLYYRLSGFTVRLPALRDRREDIPLLTDHFVEVFNRELGRNVRSVTTPVREALGRYAWPGNIREFRSAIQYALLHATADVLTLECLPKSCLGDDKSAPVPISEVTEPRTGNLPELVGQLLSQGKFDIYRRVLEQVDRVVLEQVMRHVGYHQQQAAEILGISRMTLRSKLRGLGLLPERAVSERPSVDVVANETE